MEFPARGVLGEYNFEMRLRFAPIINDEIVKQVSDRAFALIEELPIVVYTALPWRNLANYNESYIDLRFRTDLQEAENKECDESEEHSECVVCMLSGIGKKKVSFGRAAAVSVTVIEELLKIQQFRVIQSNMEFVDW
jgi:hypothetical protein